MLSSTTITLTAQDSQGDARRTDEPPLTLTLRGSPSPAPPTRQRRGPRVAWGEDVVDNEGCGKKSSKVCCIYHKPRSFDESSASESDDSSSSSEDEEDGDDKSGHEGDDGRARRVGRSHGHGHHHHQEKNAYERIPRARGKAKTNGVNHV